MHIECVSEILIRYILCWQVEYVFLVGVGGGVPHYTDFAQHVRLGDVVVSTPAADLPDK